MIRRGFPIPNTPFLLQEPGLAALRYTIIKCLFGADKKIIAQAKKWGLNFMAVSDLNGCKVILFTIVEILNLRDLVRDYSGTRNHRHRSSSQSSKEQRQPVHL